MSSPKDIDISLSAVCKSSSKGTGQRFHVLLLSWEAPAEEGKMQIASQNGGNLYLSGWTRW